MNLSELIGFSGRFPARAQTVRRCRLRLALCQKAAKLNGLNLQKFQKNGEGEMTLTHYISGAEVEGGAKLRWRKRQAPLGIATAAAAAAARCIIYIRFRLWLMKSQ